MVVPRSWVRRQGVRSRCRAGSQFGMTLGAEDHAGTMSVSRARWITTRRVRRQGRHGTGVPHPDSCRWRQHPGSSRRTAARPPRWPTRRCHAVGSYLPGASQPARVPASADHHSGGTVHAAVATDPSGTLAAGPGFVAYSMLDRTTSRFVVARDRTALAQLVRPAGTSNTPARGPATAAGGADAWRGPVVDELRRGQPAGCAGSSRSATGHGRGRQARQLDKTLSPGNRSGRPLQGGPRPARLTQLW